MEAMRSSALLASLLALPVLTLAACGDEEVAPSPTSATTSTSSGSGGEGGGTGGSGGQGGTPIPGPGPAFDRFCEGAPYDANLTPATVMPLGQAYLGVVQADPPFPIGTLETMKVIPDHPFRVETIRVAFGKGGGPARIRLMTTFGRSYPGGFPELDTDGVNVVPPMDIDVPADVDPEVPLELDVSALGVYLEPTQHYILVHEQLVDDGPLVAAEAVAPEAYSRALLFVPKEDLPYGLDANYRMELVGSYFCAWDEPKRFFGERSDVPWGEDASASATIADFDGDGHDDLVVNAGGPIAYRGDGLGGFTQPANDPFPDAPKASMLVFADVDNDGDDDAFASTYVTMDGDGDHVTILGGDCDDTNKFVKPTAAEISNGYDDNCDGLVDDGLDVTDADLDGFSIAAGDCDDTKTDAFPGAPELLDSRDNDCDGAVDQTFVNKVLLNDGTGQYYELLASGVEVLDSSTAAGFGDGDVDGIVDLYWGNWLLHYPEDPAQQDRYFEGNGDGTFTDAQANAGMVLAKPYSPYGLEWIDYNNDALPDLFVGNYHLYPNLLWKNLGGGVFTNVARGGGRRPRRHPQPVPAIQGRPHLRRRLVRLRSRRRLRLLHVQPRPPARAAVERSEHVRREPRRPRLHLREPARGHGLRVRRGRRERRGRRFRSRRRRGPLAIASLYTGHYSRLYRNDGDHFTDITYETNTAVHDAVSVVWSDVDEDGDMDLFIADRAGAPYVHLFTNRVGNTKHWVELKLSGTTTNRSAVGARVTVKAGGKTMMREVSGGNGLQNTQKSRWLHFGLADATAIDEVTVRWIGGATETISGLGVDGRFTVAEGSGAAVPAP
jgi:hypothetical protein